MGKCKTWSSTRLCIGSCTFLIYINDLPVTINKLASTILFTDDTSIIISNTNREEFKYSINSVMTELNNWFQSNLLTLNYDKTNFLQLNICGSVHHAL